MKRAKKPAGKPAVSVAARKGRDKPATRTRTRKQGKASAPGAAGAVTDKSVGRGEAVPKVAGELFPVVGVGASAGGLEALGELLAAMPVNTGMAFVIVTHQHPGHHSLLPELLRRTTRLPVVAVAGGMHLQPDHVYIGPAEGHLAILNGTLHRMESEKEEAPRLPIDYFFRSLAADQKERAICIVLSGTGTDGTLGLKAVKGESGMTMVQDVQSARYAGMPSSAAATGLADFILPPAEMPKALIAYTRGPYLAAPLRPETSEVAAEPIQKIFLLLRSRTGHDFSGYKPSTILRRVERRMNLHQIQDPNRYVRFLQSNAFEIDTLFKELLISVTSFFRDPEAFELLSSEALPALLKSRGDPYSFRAWVPGCSSGEEVYTIGIILRECMQSLGNSCEVQIFGTDIDERGIESARFGKYPDGIAVDVPRNLLERYFVREDSGYRVRTEIREVAIFAPQNVVKDPPFTKLDLISCRNLLIYLNTDLQRRLIPLFHYALKPGGLLLLGPSESIGGSADLFDVVDNKWKLYRRSEAPARGRPAPEFPVQLPAAPESGGVAVTVRSHREPNITGSVDRLLLARFVPPSVVVNEEGEILYIHGKTGLFLEPAPGLPRLNIHEMAREGLRLELASALREASLRATEVVREELWVQANGERVRLALGVLRLDYPETVRGFFLVTFRPLPHDAGTPHARKTTGQAGRRVAELERALQSSKDSLHATVEQLQSSNQELKSANEELQSTNEELQSAVEELQTSKEEMQSLNEELSTVNTELESKVEELSRSNDDMLNLLNSTEIATIFLDNDLNIKRFTEQARKLVKLREADIGRPLEDLASSLDQTGLIAYCREVFRTLAFKQAEVQARDGHWYLMRIIPYRTGENVIDGLVVTFVDIHRMRVAQTDLRRMSKVFVNALDSILILDMDGRIIDLNEESLRSFAWPRDEILGKPVKMLVPKSHHAELTAWLRQCREGNVVRNVECAHVDKLGREVPGLVTFFLLTDESGRAEAMTMSLRKTGP